MTTPRNTQSFLTNNHVTPLITAVETYDAVEHAIMTAEHTVYMAYWAFDPQMVTVSDKAPETWAELIRSTVERGVDVRILIADFDATLGFEEHSDAWRNFKALAAIKTKLSAEAAPRLQMICSRHDARIGSAVRFLFQPLLRLALRRLIRDHEPDDARLANTPGLWPHLQRRFGKKVRFNPYTWLTAYPAAHHEKLCVVDDRVAFVGGLDLNHRRLDNTEHTDRKPWHDVACRIQGEIADYFGAHFRTRWNRERDDFLARFDQLISRGRALNYDTSMVEEHQKTTELEATADTNIQLNTLSDISTILATTEPPATIPLRTVSQQAKSSFSRTPVPKDTGFLEAYLTIISQAKRLIYIETQFLRCRKIVDALIDQKARQPSLQLIVLLPLLPERMWNEKDPNPASRHGHSLQQDAINRLGNAYGRDFGVFTLMRNLHHDSYRVRQPSRLVYEHIYVHAKTIVVDDRFAIIGSANLNDRSMVTDTETGILWHDPVAVKKYRERLWTHALSDNHPSSEQNPVTRWRQLAEHNIAQRQTPDYGFVVPYPDEAKTYHTRAGWIIPDALV